jgi:catechol 2,3-dioxygenase-like lactoylglutathione lyase family enzyme
MNVEQVVPILNVSDVEASLGWFAKLGWTEAFQWRGPDGRSAPSFAGVTCDGSEIFLCLDGQGSRGRGANTTTGPGHTQRADKGAWMSIFVDDVDAVHELCLAKGLEVTHPSTDEPWGVREMHVRHPDGHVFRVGRVSPG